jgi:hypothetical protein
VEDQSSVGAGELGGGHPEKEGKEEASWRLSCLLPAARVNTLLGAYLKEFKHKGTNRLTAPARRGS